MAITVTNYIDTVQTVLAGPTGIKVRIGFGNGVPTSDDVLVLDKLYPIGSQYTDLDDGVIYSKTSAATWVNSSTATP